MIRAPIEGTRCHVRLRASETLHGRHEMSREALIHVMVREAPVHAMASEVQIHVRP